MCVALWYTQIKDMVRKGCMLALILRWRHKSNNYAWYTRTHARTHTAYNCTDASHCTTSSVVHPSTSSIENFFLLLGMVNQWWVWLKKEGIDT